MTDYNRRLFGIASLAAVLFVGLCMGSGVPAQDPAPDVDASDEAPDAEGPDLPPDYEGQDGLPSELQIDLNQLDEETKRLEALNAWLVQNAPEKGFLKGIGRWFKRLTSGKKKPRDASVEAIVEASLVQDSSGYDNVLVAVEGMWHGLEGENYIRQGQTIIKLDPGANTTISGFDSDAPDGQPIIVVGTVFNKTDGLVINMTSVTPSPLLTQIRLARCYELADSMGGYQQAVEQYTEAASATGPGSFTWSGFAMTQGGLIAEIQLRDAKGAVKLYQRAWELEGRVMAKKTPLTQAPKTWVQSTRDDWQQKTLREAISDPLDALNKQGFWYKFVDFFVTICGNNAGLGLILMACVTRGLLYPLTRKQIQSSRAMQKLQPQIKALQEKHGSDKQKFQEDFWKLCRANKVNPLGGCLPLLVQMPLLIMVYRGIRAYVVQLGHHGFLWIPSLSDPNIPLLILYTISMVAFQKLTMKSQPTMDPQQQQQQNMMVWMMPVMFFIFFQTMASGFILYWLGTNLIYLPQQYFGTRLKKADAEADKEQTVTLEAKADSGGGDDGPAWVQKLKGLAGGKKEEDDAENTQMSYEQKKQHEKRKQRPPSRRRRRR